MQTGGKRRMQWCHHAEVSSLHLQRGAMALLAIILYY